MRLDVAEKAFMNAYRDETSSGGHQSKLLTLGTPLSIPSILESDVEHVLEAIRSGWVGPVGPFLEEFETAIAHNVGCKNAVALSSGTAALHLGLKSIGVLPGQDVVVPTLTFGATAFAASYLGANPVFLDVEPVSWNLDPELLLEFMRSRAASGNLPAAIVVVDLFGRTADYGNLRGIAERYETPILEDAAEALGSIHGSSRAGSLGRAGVISFNGNKIVTCGGGGAFVSDDAELTEKVRYWSTQSRSRVDWFEHDEVGYNYRLSGLLAALGAAQLKRLGAIIDKRRLIREWYREALRFLPGVEVEMDPPWGQSNAWLSTVVLDSRRDPHVVSKVIATLRRDSIESRHIWKPMHDQPVYRSAERHLTGVANYLFETAICLPSSNGLQQREVRRVTEAIERVVSES